MYFFFHPHYYQSYDPIAYNQVPIAQSFDPRFLYQTVYQQAIQPSNEYNYPPTNPNLLTESAKESRKLMTEASKVLDYLATAKDFNMKLMDAAQQSKNEEVQRMIHSIGITSDVAIDYNPDRLRLEFKSKVSNLDCCRLSISLRWR